MRTLRDEFSEWLVLETKADRFPLADERALFVLDWWADVLFPAGWAAGTLACGPFTRQAPRWQLGRERRTEALSAAQRKAIAQKAAKARWGKRKVRPA